MIDSSFATLLTGPGAAAIAVVRLTGPLTRTFLQQHFSKTAVVGRCVHGTLRDGDRIIDDPVVVLLPDGAGADINLHGGAWVVKSMLELALRHGFTVAQSTSLPLPHEAVDGRSPIEKEVLSYLPLARTVLAVRALLAQPTVWHRLLNRINERSVAKGELNSILQDRSLYHLLHPPRVAIVGAPNVGKSTLANQLFAQERSITADLPGTTRDWVGEIANIDGLAVMLLDTPGIRETNDTIEKTSIERSQAEVKQADLVVLVLDVSIPVESQQAPLIHAYPGAIRVLNKSDRVPVLDLSTITGIQTVGTTRAGVDDLRRAIVQYFGCHALELNQPRWWTQQQSRMLQDAESIVTERG